MKGNRIRKAISAFLRSIRKMLKDCRGECRPDSIAPSCDKAEEMTVLVINGIKYIIASHFKADGKNAADSVYRLLERESEQS